MKLGGTCLVYTHRIFVFFFGRAACSREEVEGSSGKGDGGGGVYVVIFETVFEWVD